MAIQACRYVTYVGVSRCEGSEPNFGFYLNSNSEKSKWVCNEGVDEEGARRGLRQLVSGACHNDLRMNWALDCTYDCRSVIEQGPVEINIIESNWDRFCTSLRDFVRGTITP